MLEFRYIDPIVERDTAVLAISQSGETADTLAAMEEADEKALSYGASLTPLLAGHAQRGRRNCHAGGTRDGVASTKAFLQPLLVTVYAGCLPG